MPADATTTDPAPPPARWPLRPRLTLLLLIGLIGSLALLLIRDRGESAVATAIAGVLGLPEPAEAPPTTLRVIAFGREGAWEVIDLDAPDEHVADALARIAADRLTCVEFSLSARSRQQGWWAPTQQVLAYTIARAPCAPGEAPPSPADAAAAAAALADHLAARVGWAPLAEVARRLDPATERAAGEEPRRLKRGVLHNVAAAVLAVALVLSLSRRPGVIHQVYDDAEYIIRRLGIAAALGFLWTAAPAVLGIILLFYLGDIAAFLRTSPTFGWFGYVAVFIVSAGVGFLPTYGQSFLGGWVFGFWYGFPGAMLGFVGGSIIGYAIARRVSRDRVMALLNSNPKARRVHAALVGRGFWKTLAIVTLIRVPPNSPFALTNLILASSGVGLVPFIIGTAVGMAPRTGIAVWIASRGAATGARDIQQFVESQPWWVIPAGFAVLLIVLAILGAIANRALHEVTKHGADLDPAAD